MSETDAVVVAAKRTAIGKFLGMYRSLSAVELGTQCVTATLKALGLDPAEIDEVIFGVGRQAGSGTNVARQVAVRSGIPETSTALTLNMACASSLRAITLAAQQIRLGEATCIVAGGTESMTNLPYLLPRMRLGYRLGDAEVVDAMYQDGFRCPVSGMLMGETAEKLAGLKGVSRETQDAFAARSQNRAEAAQKAGRFDAEIVPVAVEDRKKGPQTLKVDEHVRHGVTPESLARLPPVFAKDGTVHAGNSSGITDGASAVVLMSAARAKALGLTPLAVVRESAMVGGDPSIMGITPVAACRALEKKTGIATPDYDLIELNEAFAAQAVACARELHLDPERLNVNGGAIALGHPIGATGARLVVTLLAEMQRRQVKEGLATLCVSGGLGMATRFTACS